MAFSASSLPTEAGRSTTSPVAFWTATVGGSIWMVMVPREVPSGARPAKRSPPIGGLGVPVETVVTVEWWGRAPQMASEAVRVALWTKLVPSGVGNETGRPVRRWRPASPSVCVGQHPAFPQGMAPGHAYGFLGMGSFCRRRGVPELFTGSSDGFDALQVKRLTVSPERVRFGDFRALEAVKLADL